MDDFTFPIPEVPEIPDFKIPTVSNIPLEINLPPIVFPPPCDIPVDFKVLPTEIKLPDEELSQMCFEVMTEGGCDIAPLVREVTYKYKPQEVTVVLADVRQPDAPGVIFDWINQLLWGSDNLVLRTTDRKGNVVYENEFLGCRLKDHSCGMTYDTAGVVRHYVTVAYDHVNINKNTAFPRKESKAS